MLELTTITQQLLVRAYSLKLGTCSSSYRHFEVQRLEDTFSVQSSHLYVLTYSISSLP
jgi:hypothetical protein